MPHSTYLFSLNSDQKYEKYRCNYLKDEMKDSFLDYLKRM
ncbi:hypothetical protein BACSP_01399 [Bacillus sp. T2.9-1]|nr:hypothetical protein BACSP_01399 [Bacillus sp. T2.9-1]